MTQPLGTAAHEAAAHQAAYDYLDAQAAMAGANGDYDRAVAAGHSDCAAAALAAFEVARLDLADAFIRGTAAEQSLLDATATGK